MIPVFNAAQFIVDCVNSVLIQTYKCFEIIMIDDGSNDGSLSIYREIAARYNNVSCYSISHQGPWQHVMWAIRKPRENICFFGCG